MPKCVQKFQHLFKLYWPIINRQLLHCMIWWFISPKKVPLLSLWPSFETKFFLQRCFPSLFQKLLASVQFFRFDKFRLLISCSRINSATVKIDKLANVWTGTIGLISVYTELVPSLVYSILYTKVLHSSDIVSLLPVHGAVAIGQFTKELVQFRFITFWKKHKLKALLRRNT